MYVYILTTYISAMTNTHTLEVGFLAFGVACPSSGLITDGKERMLSRGRMDDNTGSLFIHMVPYIHAHRLKYSQNT